MNAVSRNSDIYIEGANVKQWNEDASNGFYYSYFSHENTFEQEIKVRNYNCVSLHI